MIVFFNVASKTYSIVVTAVYANPMGIGHGACNLMWPAYPDVPEETKE